jgi:hypothetical protein
MRYQSPPTLRAEMSRVGLMPALPGWVAGNPDYETNPDLSIWTKLGSSGMPGVFDQIVQQWYRVNCLMEQGRERLGAMDITLTELPGERPEEAAWNQAAFDLIQSQRLGVEGPIPGVAQWGWRYWVALAHDAYWFGAALAAPYWSSNPGDLARGTVVCEPLMLSAVQRFRTEWGTGAIAGLDYQGSASWTFVPYHRLIHMVPRGKPGQLFGDAAIRPLVLPGLSWIQSQINTGRAESAAGGILIVTESMDAQDADKAAYLSMCRQFQSGRLPWAVKKSKETGEDIEIVFPSSSGFDFSKRQADLDAVADFVFAERNGALYSSGAGSRAASETIGDEDASSQEYTADHIIDCAWQSFARWLAGQTGYSGRIRQAESKSTVVSIDPVQMLDAIAKGQPTGAIVVTPEVTAFVHERFDLPAPPPATEESVKILQVGSLQEARATLGQLRPRDPLISPLAPEAAKEILIGAGIPADAAQRMVDFQLRMPVVAQPAQPTATPDPRDAALDDTAWLADPPACGCGKPHAVNLRDTRKHTIKGRDGRDFPSRTGPVEWSHEGMAAPVLPETHIAWMAEADEEAAALAALTAEIDPISAEHWAAVVALVRNGQATPAKLDALRAQFEERYLRSIGRYVASVRRISSEQTAAIAESQALTAPTIPGLGMRASSVDQIAATVAQRGATVVRQQARQAAASIAGRVQADASNAAVTARTAPRVTSQGLASEAKAAGANAQEATRVLSSVRDAPSGMVVIGFIRTDARDNRVCDPCRAQHGRSFTFPRDDAEFIEYVETFGPPDPNCEGGANCRCDLVPVYGTAAR